ncbi:UvrD-helicase domain-containing protein [Actinoplanes sp. NPDC049802]|uniref:PD-(D/E)XK nuclease family protein n=1 Tax=Actinoplanes sp. NPDC049802 TaxID=3154742 RepID=UPI00340D2D3E
MVRRPRPVAVALPADPVQRRVIQHTAGPLLVVGGPGTGKTSMLVESVAARIAEGADPERILVLTFGRRAAASLRDRIEARIADQPGRIVHEPLVRTFHAYAFGLLRRAAAERGEPSPRLLTGPEQDLIIRELLATVADPEATDDIGWPEALRPALPTRAFAQQLRDLMQRAAERGVGPVELARLGERLGRDDWPAAARFLREYVAVLALRDVTTRGSAAYDPAELVRAATGLLADEPGLLEAERRRLASVYVDELAETDPAQVELLSLVAGGGKPLVAFADPDSSVYGFRGADPTVVGTFPATFPSASGSPAETVVLHTNYRAAPPLLSATGRVARRMRGPIGHRPMYPPASGAAPAADGDVSPHAPSAGGSEAIRAGEEFGPRPEAVVRTFRSTAAETAYIAHALREAHLLHGVPWSRMAVLMRSTMLQQPSVQRALAAAGVPTVIHAEDLPLHLQPAVAPFLLLLRCAVDPPALDEEAAVALLHSPLGGADPLAERRLRQGLRALAVAAGDRRSSGELLVDAIRDPAGLDLVERRWARPAQAIARLLTVAREAAAAPGASAEQVLWTVWRESGLHDRWFAMSTGNVPMPDQRDSGRARQWRSEAADRDLDAMVVLFDAAARFVDRLPGAGVSVFLDHVLGQELPADSIAPSADRGEAVRLLTAHAAKGLEWDVVILAGVQEGIWPDLRLRGSLLGSERLVDVLAGRPASGPAAVIGETSALLDEERRLFYVAVTRARHRLVVTAVSSAGVGGSIGEEQPSRFLTELATPTIRRIGGGGPGDLPPDPDPWDTGPDDPNDPNDPNGPGSANGPDGPGSANGPDGPGSANGPDGPGSANGPDGPGSADGPGGPDGADDPSGPPGGPAGGTGSSRPSEATDLSDSSESAGTAAPPRSGDLGDRSEPRDSSGPAKAGDIGGHSGPNDGEFGGPTGLGELSDSASASASARPSASADLGEDSDAGRAGSSEDGDAEVEIPMGRPPRALTLASLVAELRTVVVGSAETPSRRRAAAAELARLAAAGVPGAHPDEWWGLRPLSDDRPLVDEGEAVKVTPSSMESALRCSLRWLLERHGGAAPAGPAQGIGNLVHAAAMLAEDANADREKLVEYVSARFDSIELAAQWLAGSEQERAQAMVDKLLRWLAANPRRLLAIEHEFTVRLEDERRPIQLTGRVDRLEVDEEGRLVVIDLKTGKTTAVSSADVAENPQLGGYQAAIAAGAFADYGSDSGGAALVQLGPGKDAREQLQVPLTEATDPQWAYAMVRRTADTMAAATFSAVANSRCRVCPVRTSCPISGKGRQVVEPTPDGDG